MAGDVPSSSWDFTWLCRVQEGQEHGCPEPQGCVPWPPSDCLVQAQALKLLSAPDTTPSPNQRNQWVMDSFPANDCPTVSLAHSLLPAWTQST